MEHQVGAGPARELDARNRAIFSAADGLGKLSESVVAPMLPLIILTPSMDMLKAMLSTQDGLPIASRSMVSVVRQWQLALELPSPDCVVLTSLGRGPICYHNRPFCYHGILSVFCPYSVRILFF